MKIYKAHRQAGKTTFLARWLNTTPNGILLVHSEVEAARLRKEYEHLADRIFPISSAVDGRLRGKFAKPVFAVDNLDLCLPWLLGGAIGPITTTEG